MLREKLIAAQNNVVRTNYVKAKIHKIKKGGNVGDRDEIINSIISECCKLAQKECNTRHNCVSKVIHWELFKKLKSDHTNKWHMHNPESFKGNEKYKILWDFEMQIDYEISTRRRDLVIVNKKDNFPNSGVYHPGRTQSKIKRKRKET